MNTHLLLINGINIYQGTEEVVKKMYEQLKGKHDFVTLVEVLKSYQCQTKISKV